MGRAKQMLDEKMTFEEYLQTILVNIDDATINGIAKKAIDIGFNKLSDKQQFVLKNGVADYLIDECPNCGISIDYEDMEYVIFNDKCVDCQRHWEKVEAE
jgi:RNA polymerase-binding transcription factor DksA